MSLTDTQNVAFASSLNIDKIVGVWEGSFDRATQTEARAGDINTIHVYKFEHGFTRPLFVDLVWSDDAVIWADGGFSNGTTSSLAFSDDTYIYIIGGITTAGTGTRRYKVIGSWIDSYDDTNPLVADFHAPEKEILFDSRLNYQKIHDQDVLTFLNTGSTSTQTVAHTLGYRGNTKAYIEAFAGEVWPMNGGGAANVFSYDSEQAEGKVSISTTQLSVTLNFVVGTKRVWYRIYEDA